MRKVALLLLSEQAETLSWSLGQVFTCQPTILAINTILNENLYKTDADAWLFWDLSLGMPNQDFVSKLIDTNADCWHAGLALGLGGKPEMIDFVSPTWMLNRDPDSSIEATSWRLSLSACLVRTEVLRQLGGPRTEFDSLDAASLELGLRYIRRGAFVRHVPDLIPGRKNMHSMEISFRDQLLLIQSSFGRRWTHWAIFRAAWTRFASLSKLIKSWRKVRKMTVPPQPASFHHHKTFPNKPVKGKVTVLIPTLKRYSYLWVLLSQLRDQGVLPFEVVVVDQTPQKERNLDLEAEFSDLPLRRFFLDRAGQCSSRNFGLQMAKGEYILFLDDDDEIQPDLIENHLINLSLYGINISNGVAIEPKVGALPEDFRLVRVSNVFPTNNTMIHRIVLKESGLFDLAYDYGQRADHDLGMRLYLNGELMVLDPDISVLHHHAPMGGLREHKARVDTYAASRTSLFKQILPSTSDLYLSKRYFNAVQVRERIWIDILGTFSFKGSVFKRFLKVLIAALSLPRNIHLIKEREKNAEELLKEFPQIPQFLQGVH